MRVLRPTVGDVIFGVVLVMALLLIACCVTGWNSYSLQARVLAEGPELLPDGLTPRQTVPQGDSVAESGRAVEASHGGAG